MKTILTFLIFLVLGSTKIFAFCGFYVAKAGAELYNHKSEVILVRDGKFTTITMNNDFKGDVKDFAMVVPVTNVISQEDIRVVSHSIFTTLDNYSSPRLVEYYDHNPCNEHERRYRMAPVRTTLELEVLEENVAEADDDLGVEIEAQYEIEEYEILILSAKESQGLKKWLTKNGYNIPSQAEQVLEPYIKNGLKFFVVKVNLQKYDPSQNNGFLRPIQLTVESDRFMLPIRLGMANSTGEQDMIVYAFTKGGRVESSNYRTVAVPTAKEIPTFVKNRFGSFYKDLFQRSYVQEGENAVFTEYAWNVTPSWSGVKCDPCTGNPPYFNELREAGVSWLGSSGPQVFFTRLHVRYTRDKFPEDLFFVETPNKENYQARYIITHPATGDLQCDKAGAYLQKLRKRRTAELLNMASLAGWDAVAHTDYIYTGSAKADPSHRENVIPLSFKPNIWKKLPKAVFYFTVFLLLVYIGNQLYKKINLSNI